MDDAKLREDHVVILRVVSENLLLIGSNKSYNLLLIGYIEDFLYFKTEHDEVLIAISNDLLG